MSTGTGPASIAEALEAMAALAGVRGRHRRHGTAHRGTRRGLAGMEQVGGVLAAAQGRFAAAFDAKDGHLADGQKTLRTWFVNVLGVTKAQAARQVLVDGPARRPGGR